MVKKYSEDLVKEVIGILKEERVLRKLSHEKLAEMASIHRTAVGHFENGNRKPSLYVFIKVAKALGMNSSDLIRKAEERLLGKYSASIQSTD